MTKGLFLVALVAAASALGHHSYGEYDRDTQVEMEGTVVHVMWGNPHVLITLQTEDKGEYRVEWGALFQLSRQGIRTAPIKEGDRVIVTGSVNRDPQKHILTLVRGISRPADGWRWADPRYAK